MLFKMKLYPRPTESDFSVGRDSHISSYGKVSRWFVGIPRFENYSYRGKNDER